MEVRARRVREGDGGRDGAGHAGARGPRSAADEVVVERETSPRRVVAVVEHGL